MRVILFLPQFVDFILSGQKTQTIRKTAGCKPGDRLSLRRWEGKPYRSKQQLICEVICTDVSPIYIYDDGVLGSALLGGQGRLNTEQTHNLALADGFRDFGDMSFWFYAKHGLPFTGSVISWERPRFSVEKENDVYLVYDRQRDVYVDRHLSVSTDGYLTKTEALAVAKKLNQCNY